MTPRSKMFGYKRISDQNNHVYTKIKNMLVFLVKFYT